MRRSRWISVLVEGGGVGLILLTAYSCDRIDQTRLEIPPEVTVFADDNACTQAGTANYKCSVAFTEARQAHYQRAPRYPSREACERTLGDCVQVLDPTGGTYSYVPLLAGFALGSALGAANAVPIYYDRQGNARVAGGDYLLGRRNCDDRDPQQQDCSSGGHGGSGISSGTSKNRSGTQTIDTSTTNMRSVTRGGFGHSVHGASG